MRSCNMDKACQVWPTPCIYLPGNYTVAACLGGEKSTNGVCKK